MGTLNTTLESVMTAYAKKAFNGFTTLTPNPEKTQFVVTSVGNAGVVMIARRFHRWASAMRLGRSTPHYPDR